MLRLLFCALICLGIAVGIGLWGVDRRQYFSDLKKAWKVLFGGLVLHFILLILFSKSQVAINVISAISDFMMRIKEATLEGTKFVFGYLSGKDLPFDV